MKLRNGGWKKETRVIQRGGSKCRGPRKTELFYKPRERYPTLALRRKGTTRSNIDEKTHIGLLGLPGIPMGLKQKRGRKPPQKSIESYKDRKRTV